MISGLGFNLPWPSFDLITATGLQMWAEPEREFRPARPSLLGRLIMRRSLALVRNMLILLDCDMGGYKVFCFFFY